MSVGSQLAAGPSNFEVPPPRSVLAHLLHALNQPVTGLQCSLELAAAGPRTAEQYLGTLHDALDLTARIRTLVEAVRELAEAEPAVTAEIAEFSLDALLQEQISELEPVGETKGVRFRTEIRAGLRVFADRRRCASLLFRLLESVLSLCQENSDLQLAATVQNRRACLTLSWAPGAPLRHSPFSRPELGLLLAQAGWQKAGGECLMQQHAHNAQTCTIFMKLISENGDPAQRRSEATPPDHLALEPAQSGDVR
jgi:hypothetical protein